ncbi:glycoside hydrolase family 3 protein [Saccharopolyspora flava]|uniref:Beta-glucosidase n=1 Tax=Saccharopolyspora flava TaxID=95161 RepID=A0A1I6V2L3_9PSEU|nr:glycoside hydrolase family 3 C-terminal domain-containing protein [Saccharopolyspora flava]SFT07921.1 beta-glucosidase [Saccharopolyspora flava]
MKPETRVTAGETGATTLPESSLGLDRMYLVDGPSGLVSPTFDERDTSLLLPSGIALGATWNPEVVGAVASAQACEARRRGFDAIYAPNLNLARTGLSGRTFEMLSEDPVLAGTLGAAFVAGVQQHGVASFPKHLVCNDTETERQRMSAEVDEVSLREVYLRPFEMAVRAGAWGVMAAYNRLGGTPCCEHPELLRILKGEWGFDGVVVSDYFALHDTVAPALAGLDLEMPGPAIHFGEKLARAAADGLVPPERIEDMIERLRRLARRVGKLDGHPRQVTARHEVDAQEAHRVLVEAAESSFVLVRNDNVLPLAPGGIAVLGPNADRPCYQGATFGRIRPEREVLTPLEALRARFDVVHERGVPDVPATSLAALRVSTPDGRPGVLLEHVRDGEPVLTEVRGDSAFIWFGQVPGVGPTTEPGLLRLTAVLTPDVDGEWQIGAGGSGDTTVSVDGRVLASRPAPAPGDVMGQVARAEVETGRIRLRAGEPVTVQVEMRSAGGRVQALNVLAAPPPDPEALGRAVAAAERAETVVLVVGEENNTSRESRDLPDSALPDDQLRLITEVARVNPRTVVVLNAGRPLDAPWADDVAAVLHGWYAGQGFGEALARVLAGDAEPGGRMPVVVPMRDEDRSTHGETLDADLRRRYAEPTGYRHLAEAGRPARFAFGSGVGYTTWEHGPAELAGDEVIVPITNTGERRGREVVQVYVRAPGETGPRLAGFGSAEAEPGATERVSIRLPERTWQRWTPGDGWVIPPGSHEVLVGRSSEDVRQTLTVPC